MPAVVVLFFFFFTHPRTAPSFSSLSSDAASQRRNYRVSISMLADAHTSNLTETTPYNTQ